MCVGGLFPTCRSHAVLRTGHDRATKFCLIYAPHKCYRVLLFSACLFRFVRLETDDRFAMVQAMMHVQSQTLGGYPIHARLKASATSTVPIDTAPPMPMSGWHADSKDGVDTSTKTTVTSASSRKNRRSSRRVRKKKTSGKSNNGKRVSKTSKESKSGSVGSAKKDNSTKTSPDAPDSSSVTPPSLDEDNFPTLQDKKIAWETISEEDSTCSKDERDVKDREDDGIDGDEQPIQERVVDHVETPRSSLSSFSKAMSDGASTATTTSSSTESFPKKAVVFPVGGYAAALMTAPSPKTTASKASTSSLGGGKSKAQEQRQDKPSVSDATEDMTAAALSGPPPMVVRPPTWGQGRSFADILRKD